MDNKSKIKKYIPHSELPNFFRELADAIEKGGNEKFACAEDFKQLKISAENDFGTICVKAKFKSASECVDTEIISELKSDTPIKPEYKVLKQRMKNSFKLLIKMIHDGDMPPREAVESFLDDSDLMISYPGFGDEFYSEYAKACEAFKASYDAQDMQRMHETLDVIIHEKVAATPNTTNESGDHLN